MNLREERGRQIASRGQIKAVGRVWSVSSQSQATHYIVNLHDRTCSCPDFELRGAKCKHLFAVEYHVKREIDEDGRCVVTETVRITYPQNWPAYNKAQQYEKEHVEQLLRGLCEGVVQVPQTGRGRPRLPLADVTFAAVMKVYSTLSGRRASTDLREYESKGLVDAAPHYNSVFRYLESEKLTPILKALVEEAACPLRAIESKFAVDSSGFATSVYVRWFDEKYGRRRSESGWIKAHLMCGEKTNIVTSVEVTSAHAHDSPEFIPLVESTAKRFKLAEVSADKAYLSNDNLAAVVAAGATPYIPFKSNSRAGGGSELWRRMFHFFRFDREKFLEHYHRRSNVESTFSMIKRKFGAAVRSKLPVAQMNEVYCKVLAHNLCCLVSAIYELGLAPTFWDSGVPRIGG